ncbi:MAG: large-conductance mechanosensitive channel protein MscL [Caulobacteraceae bacterium]|nr:large-conductance mechanosensitive channel protein MscL [Caulobacteraceae bacterium]
MFTEFREFVARGNVVDLAVGVIIGAAFGKIVTSLVDEVIMPPVGLLLGHVDFAHLRIVIQHADPARKLTEVAIGYGAFLNTIFQFLIVAAVIFLMVKAINTLRREEAAAPAEPDAPNTTEALLAEIRDLLAGPGTIPGPS